MIKKTTRERMTNMRLDSQEEIDTLKIQTLPQDLQKKGVPLWFKRGQTIMKKGEPTQYAYLLLLGDAVVLNEFEDGNHYSFAHLGAGRYGFMRATSMLIGGKKILMIGYGFCGTGISQRFRALGASTMVYDIDPLRMLKAKIEGHLVGSLKEFLPMADVVVTVTGRFGVIHKEQIRLMKDGVILCNAGHYHMEIDVPELERISAHKERMQDGIEKYVIDGKSVYLLQNANPLNLASGAGNPIEIMELGYALQLLSLECIVKDRSLAPGVQELPASVNEEACRICLQS